MSKVDIQKNFFGRRNLLDLFGRRVSDLKEGYRQNVALLGPRFSGKSSLLQKFLTELDDEAVISIYLNLDTKDVHYFFSKFMGSLLYNFSRTRGLPLHEDLSLLMQSVQRWVPLTVEHMKRIQASVARRKFADSIRDLLTLPEIFTVETGKFCVIVLDEFQCLEDMDMPDVFVELGKKIMTQKRCLYLVTSSLGNTAKTILSEKLSLLFGNFEVIEVGPFDLRTSQGFLKSNLKEIELGENLKNFLIDFTGGHPFYLQIISHELMHLSAVHRQNEIFLPLMIQAIENTIFSRWGVLGRHFQLVVNYLSSVKGNKAVVPVLFALVNGKHKLVEISQYTHIGKSFVSGKLNRLMELGVVVKNGNFYNIKDKLLKYWIKYVFQRRLKAIDLSLEVLQHQFRDEMEYLISSFQVISQRDLSSRIVELLHCFDNESFQLNGRRYRLPLFQEITSFKPQNLMETHFDIIKAAAEEEIWYVVLKEESLFENDVNAFLNELKKIEKKPQRRVIISLNELDANARLRALQEKMWIWNEAELNTLLNLYDKPYIVK